MLMLPSIDWQDKITKSSSISSKRYDLQDGKPVVVFTTQENDLLAQPANGLLNDEGTAGIFIQKAEYGTIPAFFFHRMIQGHREDNCRKLHPELRNGQWKNDKKGKQGQQNNTMTNDHEKNQVTNKEKAGNMKKTNPIPDCNIQNTKRAVVTLDRKANQMIGKQLEKGKGITKTTLLLKEPICTRMELRILMKLFNSQNQQWTEHSGYYS
ncbi:hypothetical protein H5410_057283 [Solanum commersonii]|uniref:Uncharacterized protein n=1 Tax=Solanum commersonii TaxID=4109 RepID=A0A9J5WP83_SOLCO|nr:hypothetical protein H5410_057283 [Solanum commersonii]